MQGVSQPKSQRILVVDDERMNRVMLCRILRHHDMEAVEVASGAEALDALDTDHFDLVLLDITMPEMCGYETLEKIREFSNESSLPVIMVTAADDRSDMLKAFQCGANDYVTKPIDPAITVARVKTQLKLSTGCDSESTSEAN